jgi:uncharacterized phage protein gp47/JayE
MSNAPALQPQLPSQLVVPGRDQLVSWWLRDYAIHNPNARIDKGSEPYLKASVAADCVTPLYYDATLIAKNTTRATMVGVALDNEAQALGTQRFPAIGASGSVIISASSNGTSIFQGDVGQIGANFYQCTQTGTYANGAEVPVQGITVGPGTNQNPGTLFTWQVQRPGCGQTATVATQADGSGLSGGHLIESDNDLRQRLNYLAANPPASGNDSEIQELASACPGLSVEKVFTYPAAQGPSSTCVIFTMRASSLGASRIPNATQIALMQAWLQGPGQMPGDLSIVVGALVSSPTKVVLRPEWAVGFPGWADASPWPAFTSIGTEPQIYASTSATSFSVSNGGSQVSIGQSVAVFDLPNLTFRRKKVLASAYAGGINTITVDTTNGISDTSYTPIVGQFVCPWSDSLQTLVLPVVAYFASLGPGEQFSSFVDPGSRQRRNPSSPAVWPSQVAARMLAGPTSAPVQPQGAPNPPPPPALATLPSLLDVLITEPVLPYSTPTGSPGVSAKLITLGDLTGYP